MKQKDFVLIAIIVFIVLIGVVGYLIYQDTQLRKSKINSTNSSVVPTSSLPNPSSTPSICKKVDETICINPMICPNNIEKCCKGLFAVMETMSSAVCKPATESNRDKPRIKSSEQ